MDTAPKSAPKSETAGFPSAAKRRSRPMCQTCITGSHEECASFDCPCVCNDDDFHATRVPSIGTGTLRMITDRFDWSTNT